MGSDIEDRYVHAALKDYLGKLMLPEDFRGFGSLCDKGLA